MKACKICNSVLLEKVISAREMMFGTRLYYNYYQCSNCKALQIENPVTDVKFLYPSFYRSFSFGGKGLIKGIRKKVHTLLVKAEIGFPTVIGNFIMKNRRDRTAHSLNGFVFKDTKILDVGCGMGELLEALATLGYRNIQGIDPFIPEDILREGWQIKKQFLLDLDDSQKFDFIMLHHSFEHMDNPQEVLQKIKQILAPAGICLIRIPVCDSFAYEEYRENWVQLDAPRHTFLHTNKSMDIMSKNADLEVKEIINDSFEFQFIGSEQYIKDIPLNSPLSFYTSFLRRIFRVKHLFNRQTIKVYIEKADNLNKLGKGDQRNYYIQHSKIAE